MGIRIMIMIAGGQMGNDNWPRGVMISQVFPDHQICQLVVTGVFVKACRYITIIASRINYCLPLPLAHSLGRFACKKSFRINYILWYQLKMYHNYFGYDVDSFCWRR